MIKKIKKLNIPGYLVLATGFMVLIAAAAVVDFEFSFDKYQSKYDQVFRVVVKGSPDDPRNSTGVPEPFSEHIREEFDWISDAANYYFLEYGDQIDVLNNDMTVARKLVQDKGLFFAEANIFNVLDFDFLVNLENKSLRQENTCVISESVADRLFDLSRTSAEEIVGRKIRIFGTGFEVTGVYRDLPANTNYPFEVLMSYENVDIYEGGIKSWTTTTENNNCLILVENPKAIEGFRDVFNSHFDSFLKKRPEDRSSYAFQPLADIHLNPDFRQYASYFINSDRLRLLGTTALVIFIICLLNFSNFLIVSNINNAKQYCIRLLLGFSKKQLLKRLFVRNMMLMLMTTLLSLGMAYFLVAFITDNLEIKLVPQVVFSWKVLKYVLIILPLAILVISLSNGTFVLKLKPANILKGRFDFLLSKRLMLQKKGIVVLQLVSIQVLIFGLFLISNQLDFINKKDLGFKTEDIIIIGLPDNDPVKLTAMRDRLMSNANITGVSFALSGPLGVSNIYYNFNNERTGAVNDFGGNFKPVDASYMDVYQLRLLAGRNLTEFDSTAVVANKKVMNLLGFENPDEVIGATIKSGADRYKVVGVVDDFHTYPLKDDIEFAFLIREPEYFYSMSVGLSPNTDQKAIGAFIEARWNELFPDLIFDYESYQGRIDGYYQYEYKLFAIFKVLSIIGIAISIFALYGLMQVIVKDKTREIAIRKIHGAAQWNIAKVIAMNILLLLGISVVLSVPLNYLFSEDWLSNFAHKISVSWLMFALGIVIVAIIAVISILNPVWKAARINPVKLLRYE